ncbi:unnamed protein product [Calicophoron daubneyi]|uniref:AAA+ ATPase domain-containing protein n=1 Tax=Calicophoron daubneyi TaxID=300641 RepID=A0AAV2T2K6_CALDB
MDGNKKQWHSHSERPRTSEILVHETNYQRRETSASEVHRNHEKVSDYYSLDNEQVEKSVLEGNQDEVIREFLQPNGLRAIFFTPIVATSGMIGLPLSVIVLEPVEKIGNFSRYNLTSKSGVIVSDGRGVSTTGNCAIFMRSDNSREVQYDSIASEVTFLAIDFSKGLLGTMTNLLSSLIVPQLTQMPSRVQLGKSNFIEFSKQELIDHVQNFMDVLCNSSDILEHQIVLKPCSPSLMAKLKGTSDDVFPSPSEPGLLSEAEACVLSWINQLENVLMISDQMRKESDETGPKVELEHWRRRMATFNYLFDQMQDPCCKSTLNILQAHRSRTFKRWIALDAKITDYANEAKDNMKFLYALYQYCEPLYRCDPVAMVETLPKLINCIRFIYTISTYYNTNEKITSLLLKVTNQMIIACKLYISVRGTQTVWSQPHRTVLSKIEDSCRLNDAYQVAFHRVKGELEKNNEPKKFEFSEIHIFGKFDIFCRRLRLIQEMLILNEQYSCMEASKIEGLDDLIVQYKKAIQELRAKPYNLLDHRKKEIDEDLQAFKMCLKTIQVGLKELFKTQIEKNPSAQLALNAVQRFEKLSIPDLGVDEAYSRILVRYGRELDRVAREYEKHKSDPPVLWDMPPVAGKISWARQLYCHIEGPMFILKDRRELMRTKEAKEITRRYNKLAEILVTFQVVLHRKWIKQIAIAKVGLRDPLLAQDPKTFALSIALDPDLLILYREIDLLAKFGMEIPAAAAELAEQGKRLKDNYDRLKMMLDDIARVDAQRDRDFSRLMRSQNAILESLLKPGLNLLNWTSLGIEKYIDDVYDYLRQMELLSDRANDLRRYRIDGAMEEMLQITLCELPESESWDVDYFVERTEKLCADSAGQLQLKSQLIQDAVYELIDMLCADYRLRLNHEIEVLGRHSPQAATGPTTESQDARSTSGRTASSSKKTPPERCKKQIEDAIVKLLEMFHHRLTTTLTKLVRNTLENLRKHLTMQAQLSFDSTKQTEGNRYYFNCHAQMAIPNVIIQPSVDDVQRALNVATHLIVSVARNMTKWELTLYEPYEYKNVRKKAEKYLNMLNTANMSRQGTALEEDIKNDPLRKTSMMEEQMSNAETGSTVGSGGNYHRKIIKNKEVSRLRMALGSILSPLQKNVSDILRQFDRYSYLWKQSREKELENFKKTNPSLGDYEAAISRYAQEAQCVQQEPEICECSPLVIHTNQLKDGLIAELEEWKLQYGRSCSQFYCQQMMDIYAAIERYEKPLLRPIQDLDDIRVAMNALKELRDLEVTVDSQLGSIEEAYALLSKYQLPVSKDDLEKADTLRYSWDKLCKLSVNVQNHLVEIQPNYRSSLIQSVVRFREDCDTFFGDYDKAGPTTPGIPPPEASDRLIIFQNRFDNLSRRYITCSAGEELFGLPVTEHPRIDQLRRELNLLQKLYLLYNSVLSKTAGYYEIPWAEVKIATISNELQDLQNRCLKLPKALKDYQAYEDLRQKLADFNEIMPLLELMNNPAMKPRHWARLSDLTGHPFDLEAEGFTLRNVLDAPLLKFKEDVEDICISAIKERDIENKLQAIKADWNSQEFKFVSFKNRGELLLRGDHTMELISLMEDSLMALSSLMSNRYNVPFRKDIQNQINRLSNSNEIIEQWMAVQNLWIYLEAVFIGGDIARQLPQEAKRFSNVDKSWQRIMQRAHETTNVLNCCVGDELLSQLLPHLMEQLELCQKSLTGYLEKKRLLFPRFFFVSDPTLLEILGQASDPHTIQAHLLSVFDNIKSVKFHEKNTDLILTCYSQEGEKLQLGKPVKTEGHVELWLMVLLKEAQHSLHKIIHSAYTTVMNENVNILEFLANFPSQVGLLGIQFIWTRDATNALRFAKQDKKIMQHTEVSFNRLLTLLILQTTKDLSPVERVKFETLITIHLHQKDIFSALVKDRIRSQTDFEWLKQTRFYYLEDSNKCLISITDVNFEYQNEFLGCTDRLAITPLTDRCYITLAQAIGMSMGGSPAGPAGTGKTETVKDMGRCLGKYVIVSNCSNQMDFRGLGRIFKGLAQSGSWGCFDEFNRIELPVLSVAAQQIAVVLTCRKERKPQFLFTDGDLVDMNPEFGIFLTMNPGYAGRQELPENLKINFRTVAMMVPDRQIIIRVKLASCGFNENIVLAQKFYTLYKLCEEQLSKQVHYDFGLRNILSVLRTLGAVKRANPNDTEYTTVMRVLRDMNLSKLVGSDEPLFMSLLDDLFPGLVLDKGGYPQLAAAINHHLTEDNLISHPPWFLKVIQLYETQRVRHGMMVLGPSGTGKTCCIRTLMKVSHDYRNEKLQLFQLNGVTNIATIPHWPTCVPVYSPACLSRSFAASDPGFVWSLEVAFRLYSSHFAEHLRQHIGQDSVPSAMTECFEPHREMRMNPKAITSAQMFGQLDVATNDWTDGIFSTLWRRTLKAKKGEHIWLILDGPVDALWIENLNSVLDDSKLLTLANGDRIPMAPCCKIMFEVDNLDNASPATVSRNGMVYISTTTLDWAPLLKGWLLSRPKTESDKLWELFAASFPLAYQYASRHLTFKSKMLEAFIIRQACDLLTGLLEKREEHTAPSGSHLERLYIFSLMWSIGALLEGDDRAKLENFLRTDENIHLDLPTIPSDSKDTAFDYLVSETGQWVHWSSKVEEFIYPPDETPEYSSILVPNVDNVRTEFLVDIISTQNKSVLLIGEPGTAKTVIINKYLSRYDPEQHESRTLNFSSVTTPGLFQRTIESFVDKRMGNTYGPPAGRKMTLFIDDISMPVVNEWGDQVANEIVRQLIEMSGFYSLQKPGDFTSIVDMQYLAAMIHPGSGRNDIPQRLKRQFCLFNCTLPSNNSIDRIFGAIAMGHYCSERGFSEIVQRTVESLVTVTRTIWQNTKGKMLPTPAKFHYIFNLRDLSRIWQGMISTIAEVINSPTRAMNLWRHECLRVLADRFTESKDLTWFQYTLERVVGEALGEEYEKMVASDQPYFVNFLRDPAEPTGDEPDDYVIEPPRVYEPIRSFKQLSSRLAMFLKQYNESIRGANMDLVLFEDTMTQLVRVARVLYMPRGHALLVGVGGSGKQSLTRLASFIAGYQTHQITLTRSYNVNNLMDDLKVLYRTAGQKGKGITFLFTDQEVKDDAFLEYLNNMLASGVISNLFARDEMDEICQDLIPIMKKEFPRRPPTNDNLLAYFYSRTRQNLHISLCFSPVGEKFRTRALRFPGLFSGCTIIWFHRWPKEALIAVADHYLKGFQILCSDAVKSEVIKAMGTIHDGVADSCTDYFLRYRRQTHVTPKSYLSFLMSYKTVYKQQYDHYDQQSNRMDGGLRKLVEAQESVAMLSKELVVKEQELEVANKEAEEVLETVTVQQNASTEVRNKVQAVKDKAQAIVDEIDRDRAIAEAKLEAAKPALQEAEDALNTIKPADIATVRRLGKPPNLIMRIMDCVLILFQRHLDSYQPDMSRLCPQTSWAESLKLMTNAGFLASLVSFPKDLINEETVELLEPYLSMDDYTLENAKKVCGNVAGLLSWTRAMAYFYSINKEVLPLKDNLVKQEARLNKAMQDLQEAQGILDEKERELAKVRALYEEALRKKQAVADDAETCRRKMTAASTLIGSLADEQIRWTEQSRSFKEHKTSLVGDVLVVTAFLSYCGPFNQEFRQTFTVSWKREVNIRKIPHSTLINVITMLTEPTQLGEWKLQGLPSDELSIQNGIIVSQARRFPLLIDPQGQGKTWIKNREAKNDLVVTTLLHKYFRQNLEDALSVGRPLLIEDVGEDLDPALDNVLERNFIKQGSIYKVKVGDKEVDVLSGFKLYITTKLSNPLYTPEIAARTSIIDFTVTMKGLEDQLLGRVILSERQELESQRVHLMEGVQSNKKKIKELEDNLLMRLASVQGSLVDDVDLIDVLSTTKTTAAEVSRKLEIASETETQINAAREEYRPIATRGSVLYFLIVEMSMVNCMYQTSLPQFLNLFDISLVKAEKSPVTLKRITNIVEYMTHSVWRYIIRGLYEIDKPTFSLLLALKIDMQAGRVRHEEFQCFIKGGASLDLNTVKPKPFKWITDMTWLHLVALSNLNQFAGILDQVSNNERAWHNWFDKATPETEFIPDGYQNSVDTFRRLLLIRSWCPDRTINQANIYVTNTLGPKFSEGFVLDLELVYQESTNRWPMVGLLSMGSDPTLQIESLAKKYKLECRTISMGQGQEVHARRILGTAIVSGGWILLQNCHLSLAYMNEVLGQLNGTEHIHEEFRLWVTTEVNPQFPITFLQSSVKFTNEPPQGVKASLKRTYGNFSEDFLELNSLSQWKPMVFAVAFLHTTVQERRQYGPLGWNIPYEFNTSDLNASLQFVQNHLDDMDVKKGIDWKCVRYMLGEIQYGGRVTDDFDKRLLNVYCRQWFQELLFTPEFKFAPGISVPVVEMSADVIAWINDLPPSDSPRTFGLHENANIAYQSKKAKTVLDCILNIQPKDASAGEGETREDVVRRMADDMLSKLPPDYIAFEVTERLNQMGALQPMNIFLNQELDRIQRLLSAVRICLTDLKMAIDGTIVMSESLREALDCMYDARIPASWTKLSWESSTLGFWFTELIERNRQFSEWLNNGRPNCFWMTGFFNPQGFLTAIRQEVTRNHKGWALDTVVLWNEVTKHMKDDVIRPPSEGAYVYGLFLEGADFDRRNLRLAESKPKVLYEPMPVVHIQAMDISKDKAIPKEMLTNVYICPVYKKPRRTDLTFIASLYLRCPPAKQSDVWVLRGTALLCDVR